MQEDVAHVFSVASLQNLALEAAFLIGRVADVTLRQSTGTGWWCCQNNPPIIKLLLL